MLFSYLIHIAGDPNSLTFYLNIRFLQNSPDLDCTPEVPGSVM